MFATPQTLPATGADMPVRPPHATIAKRRTSNTTNVTTLAAKFPVVRKLVGGPFFRDMAEAFAAAQSARSEPPRGWFPGFIETFAPARPILYLGAIAQIELARSRALHAVSALPLEAEDFDALTAQELFACKAALHPAVSTVSSDYPIHSIWKINQPNAPLVPVACWRGETALISRPGRAAEVTRLEPAEAAFLRAVEHNGTIGTAAKVASKHDANFGFAKARALLIGIASTLR
jgi:hypothetical protein